jgi:hypothetical protein
LEIILDPLFFTKSESLQEIKKRRLIKSMGFNNKVIITNGFNGSGKTLLAPLISSIKNVELMTFAYELEWASSILYSKKLDQSAYEEFVKMFVDHSIYNQLMGRNVNCRPSDLSSIFKNNNIFNYIYRMLTEGDNVIPLKIDKDNPTLSLVTNNLLPIFPNLSQALNERLVFLETVRDPMYMFQQLLILYGSVINNDILKKKDFTMRVSSNGVSSSFLDYYSDSSVFEEIKENNHDKITISYLERIFEFYFNLDLDAFSENNSKLLIIPFEPFVLSPEKYMNNILNLIDSDWSKSLKKEMKKQKVPRKLISAGKNLAIYRRFNGNTGANKSINLDEEKSNKRLETRKLINNDNLYSRLELLSDEYYKWINKF